MDVWFYLIAAAAGMVFVVFTLLYPRIGLLVWLLLAPAERLLGGISLPQGLPDITFERVTAVCVVFALVLQARLGYRRLAPFGAIEIIMIGFMAILMADLAVRGRAIGREALITFDERAIPFLLFIAAKNLFNSRKEVKQACYVIVAMGSYLALHGVTQHLLHGAPADAGALYALEEGTHLAEGRAVGVFTNAGEYGNVVALSFVWTLFLALYGNGGSRRRPLLMACLLLTSAGAFLSLTRSVWLGIFGAVLTIAVLEREQRRKILGTLLAATAVVLLAAPFLSTTEAIERRATSLVPIYQRVVMYKAAFAMFLAKPLFGHGTGEVTWLLNREQYLTSVGSLDADWGNQAGPPHNVYLATMTQWGLFGLVPYLATFLLLLHSAFELRRRAGPERRFTYHYAAFFIATTVLYLIQGMFVDIPAFDYFNSVYFFSAGLLYAERDARDVPSPS
jgi:O-Antigen ligase